MVSFDFPKQSMFHPGFSTCFRNSPRPWTTFNAAKNSSRCLRDAGYRQDSAVRAFRWRAKPTEILGKPKIMTGYSHYYYYYYYYYGVLIYIYIFNISQYFPILILMAFPIFPNINIISIFNREFSTLLILTYGIYSHYYYGKRQLKYWEIDYWVFPLLGY